MVNFWTNSYKLASSACVSLRCIVQLADALERTLHPHTSCCGGIGRPGSVAHRAYSEASGEPQADDHAMGIHIAPGRPGAFLRSPIRIYGCISDCCLRCHFVLYVDPGYCLDAGQSPDQRV